MTFKCPVHGQYDIDLETGQDPPKWCVIYREGTNEPCGIRLKRIYSVPNIRFIGSGFYVNDK